jgi:hypothetical protein
MNATESVTSSTAIIQSPVTREMWKADIKSEDGKIRLFEQKATGLNEFLLILKEKIKKGTVISIWGAGQ